MPVFESKASLGFDDSKSLDEQQQKLSALRLVKLASVMAIKRYERRSLNRFLMALEKIIPSQ